MLAIEEFIEALHNCRFVEAHEILEHDWKTYKKNGEKDKANALKGLINGATALALYYIKDRPEGYKKVWPAFEKYAPLLDKIELENMEKFHEAKDILIKINNKIVLNK